MTPSAQPAERVTTQPQLDQDQAVAACGDRVMGGHPQRAAIRLATPRTVPT